MTLIVGIQCSDGLVMASDSAATIGSGVGNTIGQQRAKKILNLSGSILFGFSGAIGMGQLVSHAISEEWKNGSLSEIYDAEVMNLLGQKIAQTVGTYLQTGALIRQLGFDASASLCKSLVAIPVQSIPTLFSFDFGGQREKATAEIPFIAIGSGQPIADPFLAFLKRLFWPEKEPTMSEGKLVAT
jgi:20S proteasome alpha/beta subunit